ncbi:MAG: hypothetical protein M0R49_09285 [Limnochordia bacterium]|jgi:hypothetical protein|nr:hypothetical protein [Limnochordia bacterium]
MTHKYWGYHGTTRANADEILRSGRFRFSTEEQEWLGRGIYFFENDPRQARNWCMKARKYPEWAVLRSKIEANVVIDLVDTETFERFRSIANRMKMRYTKLRDGRPRHLINSVVLNAMYEAEPYDLVRGIFEVPSTYTVDRTNIKQYQIQLCVRNLQCVKETSEVERSAC